MMEPIRHSRGFLPHFDGVPRYVFITYRLADSLPQYVLLELEERLNKKYGPKKRRSQAGTSPDPGDVEKQREMEQRRFIEKYLDLGHGSGILRNSEAANVVRENWHYFDTQRYRLMMYTLMPNHIHLLMEMNPAFSLAEIIHSWKSYISHEISKQFKADPVYKRYFPDHHLWHCDYWDRFIRDPKHGNRVINYILNNPVKAGLCTNWHLWPYTWMSPDFF